MRWERVRMIAGGVGSVVLGAAPHVLHHIGPLAGAAILGGLGGTMVFGALGMLLALPLLIRLRNRTGSVTAPAVALALFAALFVLSAAVVGPALAGDQDEKRPPTPTTTTHEEHHLP